LLYNPPAGPPVKVPFQKLVPASGPVTQFQTPSVPSSLAPIQPVPDICSAEIIFSSSEKIVTR